MQRCSHEKMRHWEDIPWLPDQAVPHYIDLFLLYYWNLTTRGSDAFEHGEP